MFKSKLKKGDTVIVIAGKSKGHIGKITKIITASKRCIVEGAAIVNRHKRATSNEEKSQIIKKESSIHISNIAFYDQKQSKKVKIGYEFKDDKKIRINKKTKESINA
ncbi:MAG: 50S ribosomal protein L24 [Rickettsiales bacterium]|nr:50S ribosomal protein L24 [Rickettsiales bacterium]